MSNAQLARTNSVLNLKNLACANHTSTRDVTVIVILPTARREQMPMFFIGMRRRIINVGDILLSVTIF